MKEIILQPRSCITRSHANQLNNTKEKSFKKRPCQPYSADHMDQWEKKMEINDVLSKNDTS